ncbi:MAG: PfkB family carbohydrate kinase, partial [Planctomycetota bacterium]|jgi:2-dehydro-3-deoxygluconokinase
VIADACLSALREVGIDVSRVLRSDEGRMGLYFVEPGANQRPSQVIYDRAGSTVSVTPPDAYEWDTIFQDADWFHITGITPAISESAAEAAQAAAEEAQAQGLTVSCDLNFRKKLWRWNPQTPPRELAERTVRRLLPFVDLVLANEEDAAQVLSIAARDSDVEAGRLAVDRYPEVARAIVPQFENVARVAITLRESISASHNNWGAMLYEAAHDRAFFAPTRAGQYEPYQIRSIVDRVGAGDAFAAGLIYALTTPDLCEPERALSFATAAGCLAHSIRGDFNFSSRAEVEALMEGPGTGRVSR